MGVTRYLRRVLTNPNGGMFPRRLQAGPVPIVDNDCCNVTGRSSTLSGGSAEPAGPPQLVRDGGEAASSSIAFPIRRCSRSTCPSFSHVVWKVRLGHLYLLDRGAGDRGLGP